ncbi:hypothetical protein ACJJTC_016863 [Scirpophaga incertulas]
MSLLREIMEVKEDEILTSAAEPKSLIAQRISNRKRQWGNIMFSSDRITSDDKANEGRWNDSWETALVDYLRFCIPTAGPIGVELLRAIIISTYCQYKSENAVKNN